jgi:hypothetical protein
MWKIDPKHKHMHKKQARSYTNSYAVHVYNSETTLWNLGKEGKEKRMIKYRVGERELVRGEG